MGKIAKIDSNGNMLLDCQDRKYIEGVINALIDAETRGDKKRVTELAPILENYKQLCGDDPTLSRLERQIFSCANALGLTNCNIIQRALSPPKQTNEKPPQRLHGFRGMLDSAFGVSTNEEPPQSPVGATCGFLRQLEAAEFGGSENTLKRIHQLPNSPEQPTNRFLGFGGMLTAAFGSQEKTSKHMLPKDDTYISSKPSKSEAFSWMRKKEDANSYDLLAILKNRLHAAREKGKSILVVYYEQLIQNLERRLGIAKRDSVPPVLLSGFERMLYASTHGGSQVERNLGTPNVHPQGRNARNSGWGFLAMGEAAFGDKEKKKKSAVKVFRTGDKIQSMIGFHEVQLTMTPKGIVRTFKE